ncbi:hypothetical protein [Pseudomonas sp. IT-P294]|uniref:hypothetical protein n=1 Tax=Pseudomonas sp. IT-P294 TaxID=3026454 RepID=UPI0039E1B963
MPNSRLATTNPADYRFAVHCCAHKLDLTDKPDRAVALFEHQVLAFKFGQTMWPEHFEVIDVITGERVCA